MEEPITPSLANLAAPLESERDSQVGVVWPVVELAPHFDDVEAALMARLGISGPGPGDMFEQQRRQELHDSEHQLDEIRRKAQQQAAQCVWQVDLMAKQAREEKEKRLLEEKVSQELDKFRKEMQLKEQREEERLRHVYTSITDAAMEREQRGWYMGEHGGGRSSSLPPIFATSASLLKSDDIGVVDPPFAEPAWLSDPVPRSVRSRSSNPSKGQISSVPVLPRMPSRNAVAPHPSQSRSKRSTRFRTEGDVGDLDAQRLLRLNLARLEKLERLGF